VAVSRLLAAAELAGTAACRCRELTVRWSCSAHPALLRQDESWEEPAAALSLAWAAARREPRQPRAAAKLFWQLWRSSSAWPPEPLPLTLRSCWPFPFLRLGSLASSSLTE